jgi:hypothetical protein
MAGNWSTAVASDTIVLDTAAPTISARAVSGLAQRPAGTEAPSSSTARTTTSTQHSSPGSTSPVPSTVLDDGQWHHVVAVRTSSQKLLYVDGVLRASVNYTPTLRTNNFNLRMGMNQEYAPAYYGGALDDVRVYGRALTAAEVTTLFTA